MTIFGRAFDEARLIKLAYGYEQATKWRKRACVDAAARISAQRRQRVENSKRGAATLPAPRVSLSPLP